MGYVSTTNLRRSKKRRYFRNLNTLRSDREHSILEWQSNTVADMIAEGVLATILHVGGGSKKVSKLEETWITALQMGDYFLATKAELYIIAKILQIQFGLSTEINEHCMLISFPLSGYL